VTPSCYAHMTHMLMTLAHGKVAVCLEVSTTVYLNLINAEQIRVVTILDQFLSLP
jgi:hypothetical protein